MALHLFYLNYKKTLRLDDVTKSNLSELFIPYFPVIILIRLRNHLKIFVMI